MNGKNLKYCLLSAFFTVPTNSLDGWKELGFNKISQNKVSIIDQKSIQIEVNQSASPLIYKLPEIKKVSAILVDFESKGELAKLNTKSFQEDFVLRIGLVAKGDKRLNWFQKKIAAGWVLELFSLAPDAIGLDKIYFYNIASAKDLIGQKREHPKSELMFEQIVASYPEMNSLRFVLEKKLDVVAIWISVDGDDTKSNFTTVINSLKLETE